jgi:hypothetical protein
MRFRSLLIMLCIVSRASADQAANGSNGVNVGVTGLTGANVPIGEVEDDRSGKAGYDSNTNSASKGDSTPGRRPSFRRVFAERHGGQ